MSRGVHGILSERGYQRDAEQSDLYQGLMDSGGHPQMGFTLHQFGGDTHGFLYHNLRSFRHRRTSGGPDDNEYLTFSADGKAVTMRGRNLDKVLRAIISHTVMALYEHDGETPYRRDTPLIDRVEVTLLNGED
ncbi:hypothetical protein [Roseibium marinum]|uniref:Uncharacterized protein n=1 Tax=Roseibium marinum TaxID=281252 RepID=A0A2S3UJL1_9HYPH|nr:hypothetical protein [Roseibium marinum]POF27770.1 hypothetical protein CLV41_12250 [Roseibium marinum]